MTPSDPFFSVILQQRENNPGMEEGGGLEVIDKDKDQLLTLSEEYVTTSGSMRSPKFK